MAVLWRSSGKAFDIDSLNHAVCIHGISTLEFGIRASRNLPVVKLLCINVCLWSLTTSASTCNSLTRS